MSDPNKRVHCEHHRETVAAFMCEHLCHGVGCGFHCDVDENDRWPDAWCDLCQAAFDREEEWNDSSEPKISLVCSQCYEIRRERNTYVPPPLMVGQLAVSDDDFAALADACCERAKLRQAEANRRWQFIDVERWEYDADEEVLRFFNRHPEIAA